MTFSISQLAVQMYTLRDHTKTARELAESLQKISGIGYRAVPLSAVGAMNASDGNAPEVSAAQARKMLDDNGLHCIATHRNWADLQNQTAREIDFHREVGCDFVAIGSIPGDYRKEGAQGYRRFAREAAPAIAQFKEAGIRFGYHNHAFEFERAEANIPEKLGTLFDILIEEGGGDLMMELDLYWIAHAGANPQRIVERCRGRLPVIHIKDKEMAGDEAVMAPIGEGNLDWEHLLPACEAAGVEWYAVEQDICRRDAFDCLRSSFEFLRERAARA